MIGWAGGVGSALVTVLSMLGVICVLSFILVFFFTLRLYLEAPLSRVSRTLLSRLNIIANVLFMSVSLGGFLAIAIVPLFDVLISEIVISATIFCVVLKSPIIWAKVQLKIGSSWALDRRGERADNIERAD